MFIKCYFLDVWQLLKGPSIDVGLSWSIINHDVLNTHFIQFNFCFRLRASFKILIGCSWLCHQSWWDRFYHRFHLWGLFTAELVKQQLLLFDGIDLHVFIFRKFLNWLTYWSVCLSCVHFLIWSRIINCLQLWFSCLHPFVVHRTKGW